MPTQVGCTDSNISTKEGKRQSFREAERQEGQNDDSSKSLEESTIYNSTGTMSLAGSLSLGK